MSPQSPPDSPRSTAAWVGLNSGGIGSLAALSMRKINEALSAESSPNGFLPAAENTLLSLSDDFMGKLGIEAIGVARSRNATAVDKQDILDADRRLRRNGEIERQAWILAIAGFLGGSAVAALVTLLLAPSPAPHVDYWWSCITLFAIVSSVLFFSSYPRRSRTGRR